MKIAYLIPKLKDSGLTRIPWFIGQYLSQNNEIKIFYFDDTKDKTLDFDSDCQKIDFLKFYKELNNYDIIHSHGLKPDAYVALHSAKIKAKKVTTLHGYHVEELSYQKNPILGWIFGNLWDHCCGQFDLVVCLTNTMEKYYQKKAKLQNTTYVFNGITLPKTIHNPLTNKNESKEPKRIKIVTVSVLNKRKGVDQIIRLLKINPELYLTAIGGDKKDIDNLQKLATQLQVEQRCRFVPFQDNPWEIAIDHDLFIFPSRSEGFGLSLVEAASLELPIICSDIPTFREMFTEDEVTFFKLDDINDLNQKVMRLEHIKSKKYKAKMKVENIFNIQTMSDNYYQNYLKLIEGKMCNN